ncbi:MAG: ATP-binding protein [Pseudomonadota bacterium]
MMTWLRTVWSSIVVKVTALTVAAFLLLVSGLVLLTQTPLVESFFPSTLESNASSLAELVWLVETSPNELQPFILSAYQGSYRAAAIGERFEPGLERSPTMRATLTKADLDVVRRLEERDIRFQSLQALPLQNRLQQEQGVSLQVFAALQVAVELDDGRVLNVWLGPAIGFRQQLSGLAMPALTLAILSVALGLAVAAVMLRPIRQLEQDAARVELGDDGDAVSETGPVELRRVSAALNRMRERLTALIREREQMVAAIAHDVRTGLTRIRLRLDERGVVTAGEIENDVAMMEALIADMLAYARAESPSGPQELIGLDALLGKVVDAAPYPVSLSLPDEDDFVIAGAPLAMRRLFENLLENARAYGGGSIAVRLLAGQSGRQVRIEDDGPGLPADQLDTVFEPFRRGETSRNRATGGTGLGLGIARAIAQAHGASLRVENRPEGGLAAIVDFPETLRT